MAVDGDLITITIGHTWLEIFPVTVEDMESRLGPILEAVVAGRFDEIVSQRSASSAYGRIHTIDRVLHVGAMHLPWPNRWRDAHRYEPYLERRRTED